MSYIFVEKIPIFLNFRRQKWLGTLLYVKICFYTVEIRYIPFTSYYGISVHVRVLFFRIGFDFSFDDDMTELGCEVHSFDPRYDYLNLISRILTISIFHLRKYYT